MHAKVIRYFVEVVRAGSIRKAAEQLHVVPTAVNRQILNLEEELGAPLFERIHNTLKLTPVGEIVLAHARGTLREFEPDFFFDDQTGHVDAASRHVPAGHVSSGISNEG